MSNTGVLVLTNRYVGEIFLVTPLLKEKKIVYRESTFPLNKKQMPSLNSHNFQSNLNNRVFFCLFWRGLFDFDKGLLHFKLLNEF